jgi:hypothetical protein
MEETGSGQTGSEEYKTPYPGYFNQINALWVIGPDKKESLRTGGIKGKACEIWNFQW